ncbi:sensor histidine kinase [Metabacillus sp. JX24]|uniref:sensor histidine kinase n=1 Tax=Metabacillus sp. JX24 TaxID=3240759 RepID=UPI00350EC556
MINEKTYWVLASLIGAVPLYMALEKLSISFSAYAAGLIAGGAGLILSRKTVFHMNGLSGKWHLFLTVLQMAVVSLSFTDLPVLLHAVVLFLFTGTEAIRLTAANRFFALTKELEQAEKQQAHLNETFKAVRSERHDFLKHVAALHFLLEHEKQEEAKTYLDDLVGEYEQTNLSIKGERGIVAGMLHQQYTRAKTAGITLVYDLDLPVSALPFPDRHIVALAGNLLSNSIDAAEEWQAARGKQAEVSMQLYKKSGLYLLTIKNATLPLPLNIVDRLFEVDGLTTKGGEHVGLGTKIAKDIVHKHGGYLDFIHKDEQFTVKIKIPAFTGDHL